MTTVLATGALGVIGNHLTALLDEANASISTGDHTLKILALPDVLTIGKLRVEARARGEGIANVSEVGYVQLPPEELEATRAAWAEASGRSAD